MTIIVNYNWGGRATQIVDRQITLNTNQQVVDKFSVKSGCVLCGNGLFTFAYTGVAAFEGKWTDQHIAETLTARKFDQSIIEVGSPLLGRPLHHIVQDLRLNLNGKINRVASLRDQTLNIWLSGFHTKWKAQYYTPLIWKLSRQRQSAEDKRRYFRTKFCDVRKHLKAFPNGVYCEYDGDFDDIFTNDLSSLANVVDFDHDAVELFIANAIKRLSQRKPTVSDECVSIQIAFDADSQIQITRYPADKLGSDDSLHSPWILTPRLICPPSKTSPLGERSDCGNYALGGFSDGGTNLNILTKLFDADQKSDGGGQYFVTPQKRQKLIR